MLKTTLHCGASVGAGSTCALSPPCGQHQKLDEYGWSVHRPHTIIGYAVGNAMNMGTTLAVYATLCKELGKPMVFPGSSVQWKSLTDMTDARLLAKQLVWAATTPAA